MDELSSSDLRLPGTERPGLATLGERQTVAAQRFEESGALALLLIDVGVLGEMESRMGIGPRRDAERSLGQLIQEAAEEHLDVDDLVLMGEVGRNEILVMLFREHGSSHFYTSELPAFDGVIKRALQHRGSRVFFPFRRKAPTLPTGTAVALRNPKLSAEGQMGAVIAEARDEAELRRRLGARSERREIQELVLDGLVTSVYEPIVEVESHVVFAYEALARGPEDSPYRSPLALFGAAEREDWVFELDCLCRESGLRGAVDFPSGTKLFLNILPTTIHDPNFRAERLIHTLEECKLSPSDVVFEISEQESIESFGIFKEMRDYYRNLGFQFALDDTGSGYAGLQTLLEISPEFIKVDRAFVSGIDQDASLQDMLRAIKTVAEKTGAKIIGEGLDRLEELEMLAELGIDYGQGWLFGHPTPLRAE